MLPYLLLVIVPCLFSFFSFNKKEGIPYKLPIISFFVVWLFILALRDISIGTDLVAYGPMFENYGKQDFIDLICFYNSNDNIEFGYTLYCKLVNTITSYFNMFLAITALICLVPLFILYYRESESPLLSIILFLVIAPFPMFFSGLRQAIAMAFIVPALYYTRQQKIIPFLLTVLIAFQFHMSSLILLLIYPIYHMKLDRKLLILLLIVGGVIFVFKNTIFLYLLGFAGEKYGERYGEIEETGAIMTFLLLLLMLIYSYIIPDKQKTDKDLMGLRNILLIATYIQIFASLNPIVMRMNYYFLLLVPLLISKVANRPSKSLKHITYISVCVMNVFFIYYYIQNAYNGADVLNIYPYKSCFDF